MAKKKTVSAVACFKQTSPVLFSRAGMLKDPRRAEDDDDDGFLAHVECEAALAAGGAVVTSVVAHKPPSWDAERDVHTVTGRWCRPIMLLLLLVLLLVIFVLISGILLYYNCEYLYRGLKLNGYGECVFILQQKEIVDVISCLTHSLLGC